MTTAKPYKIHNFDSNHFVIVRPDAETEVYRVEPKLVCVGILPVCGVAGHGRYIVNEEGTIYRIWPANDKKLYWHVEEIVESVPDYELYKGLYINWDDEEIWGVQSGHVPIPKGFTDDGSMLIVDQNTQKIVNSNCPEVRNIKTYADVDFTF